MERGVRGGRGGRGEVNGKDDQKCGGRPRRPQLRRTRIAARFPVARRRDQDQQLRKEKWKLEGWERTLFSLLSSCRAARTFEVSCPVSWPRMRAFSRASLVARLEWKRASMSAAERVEVRAKLQEGGPCDV